MGTEPGVVAVPEASNVSKRHDKPPRVYESDTIGPILTNRDCVVVGTVVALIVLYTVLVLVFA